MKEEDTKVVDIFDKDIENFGNDLEKMIEHLNIVIATHNKQVDEIERLHSIIDKALELIYANAYDTERKECVDDLWGNIEELVDILKGCDKE